MKLGAECPIAHVPPNALEPFAHYQPRVARREGFEAEVVGIGLEVFGNVETRARPGTRLAFGGD
jgi:hypothetical protein